MIQPILGHFSASQHQKKNKNLKESLQKLDDKAVALAQNLIEQENVKEKKEFLLPYISCIATWYQVLAAEYLESKNSETAFNLLEQGKQKTLEKQLQKTKIALSITQKRLRARCPGNMKRTAFLSFGHLLLSFSESLTVAQAFQIFGGSLISTVIMFLAFWIFFFVLPFGIVALIKKFKTRKDKIIASLLMVLSITALFWVLGALRSSVSQIPLAENSSLQSIPIFGFILINWVFLLITIYLVKEKELYGISATQKEECKRLRRQTRELEVKQQRLSSELSTRDVQKENSSKEEIAKNAYNTWLKKYLQMRYKASVELFKQEIITHTTGELPVFFNKKTPPLNL